MNLKMPVGINNKFTVMVDDIVTQEHKEYEFHNIILDSMWTRLVNFDTFFVNIHFGIGGIGAGAFSDKTRTSLHTHLGTKAAITEFQTRDLPISQWRRKIVLNSEEYVGAKITEVGVAYGSGQTNLVTHAAPKNAEGQTIAIGPKKNTEIVTIYADMFFVLAGNMYGGKIKWVTPLSGNELLNYFMGIVYQNQRFHIGPCGETEIDGIVYKGYASSNFIKVQDWIKDVNNKRITTPDPSSGLRFGADKGNGEIREFGLGQYYNSGIFRGTFPITGVKEYEEINENIGVGDGQSKKFNLSWNNPKNVTIRVDGTAINNSDFHVNPYKKDYNLLLAIGGKSISGVQISDYTIRNFTDGILTNEERTPDGYNNQIGYDVGVDRQNIDVYAFKVYGSGQFVLYGSENPDFSEPVTLATLTASSSGVTATFNPVSYRYYIVKLPYNYMVREIEILTLEDQITFNDAPLEGTINAQYKVDYIPKDENHVLDIQVAIQFGEVV